MSQLLARCPAQHAVDHYVNGESEPLVDISGDQLSGVGSYERKVAGRRAKLAAISAARALGSVRRSPASIAA